MHKNILIIEDNPIAAMDIQDMIEKMGYFATGIATNYAKAIKSYKAHKPNLILLDIDLREEKNGIDVARHIRKTDDLPIIYLTADDDPVTIYESALTKPSNYLTKPFTFDTLQTAITLAFSIYEQYTLEYTHIQKLTSHYDYDFVTKNLFYQNTPIHLTPHQQSLVETFLQHKEEAISSESLSNLVWMGDTPTSENALRTLIYRFNKKLPSKLIESTSFSRYRLIDI